MTYEPSPELVDKFVPMMANFFKDFMTKTTEERRNK